MPSIPRSYAVAQAIAAGRQYLTHESQLFEFADVADEGFLARSAFVAYGAIALAMAAAAVESAPLAALGAWTALAVLGALLRPRGGAPGYAASGLIWGGGAAAVLYGAPAGPIAEIVVFGVGLSVVLSALARDVTWFRLLCFAAPAAVLPAGALFSAVTWSGALGVFLLAVAVFGSCLVFAGISAQRSALRKAVAEQRAHARECERLEEEIRCLRLETRAAGETRESLVGELTSATRELELLRSKAGALANVLERINPYDVETGLLTAEKFRIVMQREWARMQRQELPLSLLLVSIDRFDEFRRAQTRLGYEAALRRISDVLRGAGNRPGDVAARLAPGIFALLFPETDHRHVTALAERVRVRVRRLRIAPGATNSVGALTATVGMATVIPNSGITPETLCERVEAALYEAQFQGGDRSVRYRTLDSVRVERWNAQQEGELSADGVRHKLAILGYDATAKTYRPGDRAPSRRVLVDTVAAVVEGQLKIFLESETRVLQPGDLLFIPKGLVTSVEVVGRHPVLCLEAIRA